MTNKFDYYTESNNISTDDWSLLKEDSGLYIELPKLTVFLEQFKQELAAHQKNEIKFSYQLNEMESLIKITVDMDNDQSVCKVFYANVAGRPIIPNIKNKIKSVLQAAEIQFNDLYDKEHLLKNSLMGTTVYHQPAAMDVVEKKRQLIKAIDAASIPQQLIAPSTKPIASKQKLLPTWLQFFSGKEHSSTKNNDIQSDVVRRIKN